MDLFRKSQHGNSMFFQKKTGSCLFWKMWQGWVVGCSHKQNYQPNGGAGLASETSMYLATMMRNTWVINEPMIWYWFAKSWYNQQCSIHIFGKSVVHAYIYYQWKACIWARLIFGLLIIRLDIVSLRYMRTTFTYFWYHIFRLSFGSFGFFGIHNFRY